MKKPANQEFDRNKKLKHEFSVDDFVLVHDKNLKSANDLTTNSSSTTILIFKQLIKNPYVVISMIIFLIICLMSIIVPLVSQYDETNPLSSTKTSLISWLNPSWWGDGFSKRPIVGGDDPFLNDLINAGIINKNNLSDFIQITPSGSMSIIFNPWNFLNNLDQTNHLAILGTDSLGRDIWTRLWIGTRQSLILAVLVVLVETIIGVTFGAYIGFHAGGKLDNIAMRVVEIIRSVPQLIWFILLIFILPSGFLSLFLALVLVGWTLPLARTRVQMIKIKDSEFLKASTSLGNSKNNVIFKHALPNIFGKLLPSIVLRIPMIIFMESSLAFLGLSPNPHSATLGNLINDAKSYIQYWWYLLAPTTVILFLTIALQIIGNGLHDAFDPQTR